MCLNSDMYFLFYYLLFRLNFCSLNFIPISFDLIDSSWMNLSKLCELAVSGLPLRLLKSVPKIHLIHPKITVVKRGKELGYIDGVGGIPNTFKQFIGHMLWCWISVLVCIFFYILGQKASRLLSPLQIRKGGRRQVTIAVVFTWIACFYWPTTAYDVRFQCQCQIRSLSLERDHDKLGIG